MPEKPRSQAGSGPPAPSGRDARDGEIRFLRPLTRNLLVSLLLALATMAVLHWLLVRADGDTAFVDWTRRVAAPATPAADDRSQALRLAVATLARAESTPGAYERLGNCVARTMGRHGSVLICPSGADARRELGVGRVDVALLETGSYALARAEGRAEILAEPELEPGAECRCLWLVPAAGTAQRIADLRGGVMAFTDPESLTGRMAATVRLLELGHTPEAFFRRIVYTGGHDRSVRAVATGVVDGAVVSSLVWSSMLSREPDLAPRTRVIWQSEPFGPPPLVAPAGGDPALKQAVQQAFLTLHQDREGVQVLEELGLTRFVAPRPETYHSALAVLKQFRQSGGTR
jgi:phosphonate transport system substrate-binding protein